MGTVGDLAPEVFDAEYKGSQDASKGIIGMLEVILSDFDRTGVATTDDESAAVSSFQNFKSTNEADTNSKETLKGQKETSVETIEGDLVSLNSDLRAAQEAHQSAIKELSVLHTSCVQGEETYEQRVAQRNKEIEALKKAHAILEDWQK